MCLGSRIEAKNAIVGYICEVDVPIGALCRAFGERNVVATVASGSDDVADASDAAAGWGFSVAQEARTRADKSRRGRMWMDRITDSGGGVPDSASLEHTRAPS